ncbi:retrovirus-related pol polyprotein from transposon TNT 1-94 [Tanacetum coccineum]
MTTSNSSVNVSQPQIPVFKGDSYEFWSIKMKTLFRSQNLWDLVDKGCADSTSENQKRDTKALFFIQQAVDETILSRIVAANSAKEACDTLKTEYQSSAKVITVNQMRAYGDKVADEIMVAKILRSLSSKFDHVVAAIEEPKDLSTYSVDELMGSLQTHEARINRNVVKEEKHAFHVQGNKQSSHIIVVEDKVVLEEEESNIQCNDCWRQLMDRGFDVFFNSKNKTCTVIKDGEVMVKSSMTENRMFPVDFSCDNIYGLISSKEESTDVWHQRYGHLTAMSSNRTRSQVTNRKRGKDHGKIQIPPTPYFPPNLRDTRTHDDIGNKQELVHADIYGPMKTDSYAGKAFGFFKKFKALAENQSNRKLKGLNWTKPELQGGMLKAKNVEDAFWAETVATTVYLTSISHTKAVWNITSFEAWQESKPSVSHLRIFGCTRYALIPCGGSIFVGYSTCSKAYRLFDQVKKTIIISRDVQFNEQEVWDKNMMGLGSSVNLEVQKEGITEEQPNTTCSLESNVTPSGISQVNTRGDTSQSITTQSSSSSSESSEEDTEKSAIGWQMQGSSEVIYLTHTRPDLAYAVGLVSRFMHCPSKQHYGATKRILRYIAGTTTYGIWSSHLGVEETSYCRLISAATAACQAVWLRRVLEDLNQTQDDKNVQLLSLATTGQQLRKTELYSNNDNYTKKTKVITILIIMELASGSNVEFLQKPSDPYNFANNGSYRTIFCLSRGTGNDRLFLGFPRDGSAT